MSDRYFLKYLRPVALLLSASLLMCCLCACGKDETPDSTDPNATDSQVTGPQASTPQVTDPQKETDESTSGSTENVAPTENPDGSVPEETTSDIPVEEPTDEYHLGSELVITDIGKYAGIFMEDGSDEVVSDILMLILRNDNERDLQLARIELRYEEFTAEFEVTNLPAGESVVLLEKNRRGYVQEDPYYLSAHNVAFFQDEMGLQENTLKISGAKGSVTVENLSDQTLGEIYVYYKNSAVDLLYGGITYRARVEAGLAPGDSKTVMTGHYNPDTCTIVNVQIAPVSEQ